MFELTFIWERTERWLRVFFDGETIANSRQAMLMIESDRELNYYFPLADVRQEFLNISDTEKEVPGRGRRRFWHVVVDGRRVANAAWTYDPAPNRPDFNGYISFKWAAMDHWFEENEEVFLEPRNPYHRVDFIPSTRHVVVQLDDQVIAETHEPLLVFETNNPIRFYFAPADVNMEFLVPSDLRTRCQYKGLAHYYSLVVNGAIFENRAWTYPDPLPESDRVASRIAFHGAREPRLQIWVDGERYQSSR